MKTKYILIFFLAMVLLGMAGSSYSGYDAYHNDSNSIACSDCHRDNFPFDDICLWCHTNDTGGGYSKMSAPKVLGHSSTTTSGKYGTWSTLCKDCHYPHDQPRVLYGSQTYLATGNIASVTNNGSTTTYGYTNLTVYKPEWANPGLWGDKSGAERGLILIFDPSNPYSGRSGEIRDATASTITITGSPNTLTDPALVGQTFALVYGQHVGTSPTKTIRTPSGVVKPAKFFNNTGPNSFAYSEAGSPTDPVVDGVCQVCHTQTSHWRSDGSLAAVGVHAGLNGADCMQCHKHEAGFKAAGCNTCHGYPPIVDNPPGPLGGPNGLALPATGSTTAGAHNRHVNGLGIDCEACHFNSAGSGPTHNDGTIQAVTLGFYLFNGTVQGGSYNGQ